MNKFNINIYSEANFNIFSLLSDVLPNIYDISIFSTFQQLNYQFTSKINGRKLSGFMDLLIDEYGEIQFNTNSFNIKTEGRFLIKTLISDRFKEKWSKLNELWNTPYDPLSPFNITLKETKTDKLTVNEDISNSNSEQNIYGFNSVNPVPSDNSSNNSSNKYNRDNPTTRDYTRVGNIGNTSKQELIEKQREVLKYQITDTIFKDIATVVCRGKYI